MKKTALFTALTALLLVAGCSTTTTLTTPEPHPEKYALQVIRIEVSVGEDITQSPQNEPNALPQKPTTTYKAERVSCNIETLLQNPKASITEYPVVYATVGETAINDQTETISLPESFEPQTDTNGNVNIIYTYKDVKIGQYAEMTLQKVENNTATCDLQFYENHLQGMQQYESTPTNGSQKTITASMPVFKKNGMNTKVDLGLGSWISMGGLIREQTEALSSDEIKKTQTSISTWIRILPPANTL